MIEDELFAILDPALAARASTLEEGEEYRVPPLDVLRYYRRPARLHWLPWLGRGWGVTAVVRQPIDVGLRIGAGYAPLLDRVGLAVHSRFPPGRDGRFGTIGLTVLVLTPEPIGPDDDEALQVALNRRRKARVFPLGLLRVNLGQAAMAMALTESPDDLFPETVALADALTPHLRRFVPIFVG